jgi:hypothetical protein
VVFPWGGGNVRKVILLICCAVAAVLAPSASAYAFIDANGKAFEAPGLEEAAAECGKVINLQTMREIVAGGGPKAGIPAPTNCDHFFQIIGAIGKS